LRDSLTPVFKNFIINGGKAEKMVTFSNAIKVCAIVGGAAACRGGLSAKSADEVVTFMTDLACTGLANWGSNSTVGGGMGEVTLDRAKAMGGQGFGTMLATEGGGPFWRQRAASIALPRILLVINEASKSTNESLIFGCLCAVGHFACTLPLNAIGNEWAGEDKINIVGALMVGLVVSERGAKISGGSGGGLAWGEMAKTALAALVRLTAANHESIVPYLPSIFPALLHFAPKQGTADNAEQLLALQCLLNLVASGNGGGNIGFAKIFPFIQMVIFKLDQMLGHKQRRIRMAAVVVRNAFLKFSAAGGGN
jgi:hypothetical protein